MMNDALMYVISFPYFWISMGVTVASSMFIGAILYNGDVRALVKGMVSLITYFALLMTVTVTRVNISLVSALSHDRSNDYMAYAGIVTLLIVTLFYVTGLLLGVFVVKKARKAKHG